MDTRFLLVLGAVALLQSLLAKKKRASGADGMPEGISGAPEDDALSEEGGEMGGRAADPRRPGRAAADEGLDAWRLPSQGESAERTPDAAPVPSGPRSRTANPGAVRRRRPAGAEPKGRGKGLLAELFAELEAQAKKDVPFPLPGGSGAAETGAEAVPPARQPAELPSFGLEEAPPADRGPAEGRRRTSWPGAAGDGPRPRPKAGEAAPRRAPRQERPPSLPLGPAEGSQEAAPRHAPSASAQDLYGLDTIEGLKRAIVAREVLGPPLALRDKEETQATR